MSSRILPAVTASSKAPERKRILIFRLSPKVLMHTCQIAECNPLQRIHWNNSNFRVHQLLVKMTAYGPPCWPGSQH